MPINLPTEDEMRAGQLACEIADYEAEHAKLFLLHDFDLAAALSWIREHIFVCSRHSYLQGVYSQKKKTRPGGQRMSGTINWKEAEFDFSEAADIIYDKLFMFHGDEFDYEEGLKAINACTWVLNGMMRQMIKEHDAQAKL